MLTKSLPVLSTSSHTISPATDNYNSGFIKFTSEFDYQGKKGTSEVWINQNKPMEPVRYQMKQMVFNPAHRFSISNCSECAAHISADLRSDHEDIFHYEEIIFVNCQKLGRVHNNFLKICQDFEYQDFKPKTFQQFGTYQADGWQRDYRRVVVEIKEEKVLDIEQIIFNLCEAVSSISPHGFLMPALIGRLYSIHGFSKEHCIRKIFDLKTAGKLNTETIENMVYVKIKR